LFRPDARLYSAAPGAITELPGRMLFNSFEFVFGFLPLAVIGFFLISRRGSRPLAIAYLSAASMFFYAWWSRWYLLLILAEVVFNFLLGRRLARPDLSPRARRLLTVFGVGTMLVVLGYFKYTYFILDIIKASGGPAWSVGKIILPLGISFHSFQQIAYLVDSYKRKAPRYGFGEYCLFVTFFPQLIAGPIVHHNEIMPQLQSSALLRPRMLNLSLGLAIFSVGLFKKTVIADGLAQIASPMFNAAATGTLLLPYEAWAAAIAWSLQLYFDFSAYSDMAIGLARLFNIRLPANFYSPYRATNIADFWRRWHMTLSRFLRNYLYIPLGGNRRGRARQVANLMITMLLGGLWHGAGWTFVLWGGMHGLYLVIHRLWTLAVPPATSAWGLRARRLLGWLVTTLAVVVAWVFFRAADYHTAQAILQSMAGLQEGARGSFEDLVHDGFPLIVATGLIAVLMPNVVDIFRRYRPALLPTIELRRLHAVLRLLQWRPRPWVGIGIGALAGCGLIAILGWQSEFLYFQF
jgi:alginate O-acetyltransferase complex protein AlgI